MLKAEIFALLEAKVFGHQTLRGIGAFLDGLLLKEEVIPLVEKVFSLAGF